MGHLRGPVRGEPPQPRTGPPGLMGWMKKAKSMTSELRPLWPLCTALSRHVLPLVDREAQHRARRHQAFHRWDLDASRGDRLLTALAALAIRAVMADAVASGKPSTPEALCAIPLSAVAEAVTSKADFDFLAGTADNMTSADPVEDAVRLIRLLSYGDSEQGRRWMFAVSRELHRALVILIDGSPEPAPQCGALIRWADTSAPRT